MATVINVYRNSVTAEDERGPLATKTTPPGPDKRTYTEIWTVEFDQMGPIGTPEEALAADGIPQKGQKYQSAAGGPPAFCKKSNAKDCDGDYWKWRVSVTYESLDGPESESGSGGGGPPTNGDEFELPKPQISYDGGAEEYDSDHDANGLAYVNSAGTFFDPPMKLPRGFQVITLVNYDYDSLSGVMSGFGDEPVNKETFLDRQPGTVVLKSIRIDPELHVDKEGTPIDYWKRTFTFWYRLKKWLEVTVDQGYVELVTATSTPFGGTADSSTGAPAGTSGSYDGQLWFGSINDTIKAIVAAPKQDIRDEKGVRTRVKRGLNGKGKAFEAGVKGAPLYFARHRITSFEPLKIKLPKKV